MFQTALSLSQQQKQKKIPTGNSVLDTLLEGGYELGLSYLLYGSPRCTRLLQYSIAQALRHVTTEQGVAVIDANNGIRPNLILSHLRAIRLTYPPITYLNRLHIARAFTTDQLLSLLEDTPDTIQDQRAPILFVNGLVHLLQEEEEGEPSPSVQPRTPLHPRAYRRAQLAALLKHLAFTQQVAVVVSADAPQQSTKPPLRIGQSAFHRFHALIRHSQRNQVETFILEKHPSRPWMQRSRVTPRTPRRFGMHQTTL
jgi:RecA/RadA recombinase